MVVLHILLQISRRSSLQQHNNSAYRTSHESKPQKPAEILFNPTPFEGASASTALPLINNSQTSESYEDDQQTKKCLEEALSRETILKEIIRRFEERENSSREELEQMRTRQEEALARQKERIEHLESEGVRTQERNAELDRKLKQAEAMAVHVMKFHVTGD